jgi:hypothetical protein
MHANSGHGKDSACASGRGPLRIAHSLEEAAKIAAESPCLACGLSYEIRPLELEPASAYKVSNETPR